MPIPGILILSAPSGAGKTSLAQALVDSRADAELTISHTTRPQRPGEKNGQHYHFVDEPAFGKMIETNQFIEHATVYGHYYGTSVKSIEALILNDKHAILDIDWQGARNVRHFFQASKSVFIMPPSLDALERRLRERRQDSEEVIARRMGNAQDEMSHRHEYNTIIVNDDFDMALAELQAILDSFNRCPNATY